MHYIAHCSVLTSISVNILTDLFGWCLVVCVYVTYKQNNRDERQEKTTRRKEGRRGYIERYEVERK